MAVNPIPEGHHTLTPHLTVKNAAEAIEFYKKAFSAEEVMRIPGPDGRTIMHAELRIGDSMVYLANEFPEHGCVGPASLGGSPVTLHLYVPDIDGAFDQAVKAGAQVRMPVADMFWGDRYGQVVDPFGHVWSIATHKEDLTPEQCAQRAAAAMSGGDCGGSS
ncbi:MAG: VOC family protein [Planctomycetota bacterium]|nr:MAG: VOC family protein [Planctomycetota bacterium]